MQARTRNIKICIARSRDKKSGAERNCAIFAHAHTVTRFTFEGMSGDVAAAATGAPKPPPDPFYTLRPHAGDVTAVQYLNLESNGGIVSGYVYTHRTVTRICIQYQ